MLTRTLPPSETKIQGEINTPEQVEKQVDERWFFLYEWISPDELRMTLERDYLRIVRKSSIPLAIITAIAGFIGFAWGPIGTIIAILITLGIFYSIIGIILALQFFYRSYLYTRGANVIITDNHYVSWWKITEKWNSEIFKKFEDIFDEPFLWKSKLAEKKAIAKTELFDNLKEIASGWWKILQSVWRSRDSGGIVLVILIASFLYAAMMGLVYFIGIFFITIFGRIFSWLAHRYLIAMNNTEHKIQNLFWEIHTASENLKFNQKNTISLLTDAWRNEWTENLSGRLSESFEVIGKLAETATDKTIKLRKTIESSSYKDIFNFNKYGSWVKTQILEPIESILLLLSSNSVTLKSTISSLENQISETSDPSLQKPLILQQERLKMQIENFERVTEMLEWYREKLK